jgi:hypothetical protein
MSWEITSAQPVAIARGASVLTHGQAMARAPAKAKEVSAAITR